MKRPSLLAEVGMLVAFAFVMVAQVVGELFRQWLCRDCRREQLDEWLTCERHLAQHQRSRRGP